MPFFPSCPVPPRSDLEDSAYSSGDSDCTPSGSSDGSPYYREDCIELHSDLLGSDHMEFKLNMPTLGVSSISMEYIYELATRLLFISVDWARSIPAFRGLDPSDQLALLQNTWSDIFMLGVAQCSQCFPLSPLLTLAASQLKSPDGDRKPSFLGRDASLFEKVVNIKDLVFSLEKLDLGQVEYAYLKTIIIFNSDCQSLKNPKVVERLQEKAHCSLKKYVDKTYPQNPERFAKVLLRLPAAKSFSPDSIEKIFFAPLIGTVRIENIMANIMNNSIAF